MQAILSEASPLTATPKGVIQKMGNKIDIILSESEKAKKRWPRMVISRKDGMDITYKC